MRLPENGQTVHLRRRPCFAQVGRHPKAGWEWWIVGEWLMKLDETGWNWMICLQTENGSFGRRTISNSAISLGYLL